MDFIFSYSSTRDIININNYKMNWKTLSNLVESVTFLQLQTNFRQGFYFYFKKNVLTVLTIESRSREPVPNLEITLSDVPTGKEIH